MKLENPDWQVVNSELSKKLKKLGYKQEGLWWWSVYDSEYKYWAVGLEADIMKKVVRKYCVAPTVAELGERLPHTLRLDEQHKMLTLIKTERVGSERRMEDVYAYYYIDPKAEKRKDQTPEYPEYETNEANARAKMWIYLKEEKLI